MDTPSSHLSAGEARPAREGAGDLWPRLAHRWFVEFNPLYLLSAALVLGGCFLLSRGLATEEDPRVLFAISLVSEVYAWSLLAGVALLIRIGSRRPAVMLALLAVLYQWDVTLHTETCAYVGAAGPWASGVWLGLFVAKLYALAWALQVRYAKAVIAAAVLAALGLTLGPHLIPSLGGRNAGALVAAWCFALGALHRPAGVESRTPLTPWGDTVLRRTTRAAWLLSGALVSAHVLFWTMDHAIALSSVLPVVPLLHLRRVRSEGRMWAIAFATLVIVGLVLPGAFFSTSLLVAAALLLRAFAPHFVSVDPPAEGETVEAPYRSSGIAGTSAPSRSAPSAPRIDADERARSLAGAVGTLYLAAWTHRFTGSAWPPHVLALDLALTVALLLIVWRFRIRTPLAPLALSYAHLVVQGHLLPAPRSTAEWGATFIGLGFAVLAASLAASYRFRRRPTATTFV